MANNETIVSAEDRAAHIYRQALALREVIRQAQGIEPPELLRTAEGVAVWLETLAAETLSAADLEPGAELVSGGV